MQPTHLCWAEVALMVPFTVLRDRSFLKTGEAKITPGYRLKAKYVIHAVGPVWRGGKNQEDELLRSAYRVSLQLASAHHCRSVAFPCISTGVYGFPFERAERLAIETIKDFLKQNDILERVLLVCFSDADFFSVNELLKKMQ
jgi:O-acetyl-ADP-ribose deacetylase